MVRGMEIYSRYYHIRVTWNHSTVGNSGCASVCGLASSITILYRLARSPTACRCSLQFSVSFRLFDKWFDSKYCHQKTMIWLIIIRFFIVHRRLFLPQRSVRSVTVFENFGDFQRELLDKFSLRSQSRPFQNRVFFKLRDKFSFCRFINDKNIHFIAFL